MLDGPMTEILADSFMAARVGVLLLSKRDEAVYVNRVAAEAVRRLNEGRGMRGTGCLPAVIEAFYDDLMRQQQHWPDRAGSCPSITTAIHQPFHAELHGIVLPIQGFTNRRRYHVLILIDFPRPERHSLTQAAVRFHLTKREQDVLDGLLQGWTNKEIGHTLGISEGTVKVFIKGLMSKMHCRTRTGLVSVVLKGPATMAPILDKQAGTPVFRKAS